MVLADAADGQPVPGRRRPRVGAFSIGSGSTGSIRPTPAGSTAYEQALRERTRLLKAGRFDDRLAERARRRDGSPRRRRRRGPARRGGASGGGLHPRRRRPSRRAGLGWPATWRAGSTRPAPWRPRTACARASPRRGQGRGGRRRRAGPHRERSAGRAHGPAPGRRAVFDRRAEGAARVDRAGPRPADRPAPGCRAAAAARRGGGPPGRDQAPGPVRRGRGPRRSGLAVGHRGGGLRAARRRGPVLPGQGCHANRSALRRAGRDRRRDHPR